MSIFYTEQQKSMQCLYLELLQACASLSALFSDNTAPYLYYRTHENIFSYSFGANNLAREDISIDSKKGQAGIGLKTFLLGTHCSCSPCHRSHR